MECRNTYQRYLAITTYSKVILSQIIININLLNTTLRSTIRDKHIMYLKSYPRYVQIYALLTWVSIPYCLKNIHIGDALIIRLTFIPSLSL